MAVILKKSKVATAESHSAAVHSGALTASVLEAEEEVIGEASSSDDGDMTALAKHVVEARKLIVAKQAEIAETVAEINNLQASASAHLDKILEVSGLANNTNPAASFIAGPYVVEIGNPHMSRKIKNVSDLYSYLGHEQFLKIAKVNLGDVDKYVPESKKPEILSVSYDPKKRSVDVKSSV